MSIEFSVDGIRFRITDPSNSVDLCLPDEYSPFHAVPGQALPDAVFEVIPCRSPETKLGPGPILWANELWRLRDSGADHFEIEIHDGLPRAWRRVAAVTRDFAAGQLFPALRIQQEKNLSPFHNPQDRTLVLGRLCHLGGAMLHASSVLVEGRAMLFTGMSGAGKTTIARLWRTHGATILNDERNLIRPSGEQIMAGASPWHGEENQVNPAIAPLAAIFYLKQSAENSLRPLSVVESLPRLLTTTFVPVFLPDGPERTLNSLGAILERVPAYELSFTPGTRALELCRSAIGI